MTAAECSILGFVALLLAFILGGHRTRIKKNSEKIETVSERVTKIETTQEKCQEDVRARLDRGDKSFDRLDIQVSDFKTTNIEFRTLISSLGDAINKIDDRQWQEKGSSKG